MSTDHYEILGVTRTATPDQIRAAHRVQSRKYHPDTAEDGCGDPKMFARTQEAYEILSNPDTRRRYDTKDALASDDILSAPPRPLPKRMCAVCQKDVIASELTLYLGRRMCKSCLYRKQQRAANRARLTGLREIFWQIKCLRFWLQRHWAIVLLILIACGISGMRLRKFAKHTRQPFRPPTQLVVPDVPDFAVAPAATQPSTEPSIASLDERPLVDNPH